MKKSIVENGWNEDWTNFTYGKATSAETFLIDSMQIVRIYIYINSILAIIYLNKQVLKPD